MSDIDKLEKEFKENPTPKSLVDLWSGVAAENRKELNQENVNALKKLRVFENGKDNAKE